jgi:hypothetical protein
MTVYLIAQPTVSNDGRLPKLEPLAKYGTVRVLVNPGEDPRYKPQRALDLIVKRLADFNPADDYLVWAGGDTLAAVLTGIVLADLSCNDDKPFTSFRWLRWERGKDKWGKRTDEGGHYVPIRVPLPNPNHSSLALDEYDPITTE